MDLQDLNKEQLQAVRLVDQPLLISAGAGSGKTRVITYKIAYLIKKCQIKPYKILGITFTNKAANEMLKRVMNLTGLKSLNLNISTFHSFCTRVLKQELPEPFIIIDESDKKSLLKDIITELQLDMDIYNRNIMADFISRAKMNKIHYDHPSASMIVPEKMDAVWQIYRDYEKYKQVHQYFDFDDLLIQTLKFFYKNKQVLDKYRDRFEYILVDEFQDTNDIQYELIYALGYGKQNITIVGDPDQSIYSWRGASSANFRRFIKDFKDHTVIKLEQNYRSVNNILRSAGKVISYNSTYDKKKLWSDKPEGDRLKVFSGIFSDDESRFVAETIDDLLQEYQAQEIAVFCRTNYYYQNLEFFLREYNIPYQIIGGVKFFERQEIRNLLAYLKFLINLNDDISLLRIMGTTVEGVGRITLDKLKILARNEHQSLYQVLLDVDQTTLSANMKAKINNFILVINDLLKARDKLALPEFIEYLLEKTRYQQYLEKFPEFELRLKNIEEFIKDIADFHKRYRDSDLRDYIDRISLLSEIDKLDENTDKVNIITIHNAKGLEFKVIFIIGLQEGMFPHYKVLKSDSYEKEIEEERRLFYVGLTRAQDIIFLTNIQTERSFYGKGPKVVKASRFLSEIPQEYKEEVHGRH